jgi:adhesin transport system outer membrane protein
MVLGAAGANEARPPLTALPAQVNSLVMSLGEEQIAAMESFLKQGEAPGWDATNLKGFLRDVRSATLVHPDVMAASAARGAARQAIREAQAARLPQVSAQLENSVRSNDPSTLLNTPGRDYSTAAFTVTVRQLLYDFGASESAIAGSSARDEQAFFRLQLTRSEVALRAVLAFHDLVRAVRQLELARRNEQARVSIVDLVKQRYDLGGGTLSDVVRAQSRLAEATSLIASAQQKVAAAQVAYRDVFNQAPPPSSQAGQFAFAVTLEDDFRVQLAQSGLETWRVRIAQSARQAAQADLQNAKGRALPAVNLELTNSRRDLMGGGSPGTDRSIMLVARQSLFSGWADTARVDQAVQKLRQSEEELESARRESSRTLDQALLEAQSITDLVKTRAVAARLAADSLRMIREQYAYRRGTLLDLLTAQEALYSAGRDFIDVQVDEAVARFRVLHAASLLNRFLEMADPDSGR